MAQGPQEWMKSVLSLQDLKGSVFEDAAAGILWAFSGVWVGGDASLRTGFVRRVGGTIDLWYNTAAGSCLALANSV